MRLRAPLFVLALTIAAAASAFAQEASKQTPATKMLVTTMRENVDRISPSLEHDRWDANIRLWEVYFANPNPLKPDVIRGMRDDYNTIATIVAGLVGPEEKERWSLNRDLWDMMLDVNCAPPAATLAKMRPLMKALDLNLARITAAGERQRWTANYELWKGLIGD